ncbi:MAG: hypothetical protein HY717_01510 [Planctomycetes bacterium]|nr:hypothetical protein [Planctomycetota bacterium]
MKKVIKFIFATVFTFISAAPLLAQPGGSAGAALTIESGIPGLKDFPKFQSVNYILDPGLREADSAAYATVKSFNAAFFKAGEGQSPPKSWDVVKDIFFNFFNKVAQTAQRSYKDLDDFLEGLSPDKTDLVTAVKLKFQVPQGARKEGAAAAAPPDAVLECSVEFRVFALRKSRPPEISQEAHSISLCELLYQDTSTGRIGLAELKDKPEEALRAALIKALAGGVARSYCQDPKIKNLPEGRSGGKGPLGPSISY